MRYSAADAELRTDGDIQGHRSCQGPLVGACNLAIIGRRCLHPSRDAPDARLPEDVDELLTDRAH